jgi:hypothetical protein
MVESQYTVVSSGGIRVVIHERKTTRPCVVYTLLLNLYDSLDAKPYRSSQILADVIGDILVLAKVLVQDPPETT